MADTYQGFASLMSQAEDWTDVTPSATPLATTPKALWVNVAGDLVLVSKAGNTSTFTVAASTPLPFRPAAILATSTATGIKALY